MRKILLVVMTLTLSVGMASAKTQGKVASPPAAPTYFYTSP